MPAFPLVTAIQKAYGIRSHGTASERSRKNFHRNLEDQDVRWLSLAQALDRIPPRSADPERPLSALQNLLCRNSPSPLPQEPRTSPHPATRILSGAQGGDFGGTIGATGRKSSNTDAGTVRLEKPKVQFLNDSGHLSTRMDSVGFGVRKTPLEPSDLSVSAS